MADNPSEQPTEECPVCGQRMRVGAKQCPGCLLEFGAEAGRRERTLWLLLGCAFGSIFLAALLSW